MARADNTYSRVVAWMKIILPLAALGLLSTVFMISRTVDPTQSIPISQIDIEQRAQDMGATRPSFAGVTKQGDEIRFAADSARPERGAPEILLAEGVHARMALAAGTVVDITSSRANMNQNDLTATLDGEVQITTSSGYLVDTDRLTTRLDAIYAESPGQVTAVGSIGHIDAGRMLLRNNSASNEPELLFTGGVKLIYRPDNAKE
ncbi:LPS export ABC transporter periplasmic protein LptC [Roseovarius sp.]|uniref:LPS export ABC transporter periplasmic protein LptC n=1 Tax=Roseovarius sp. TaxID=1486281 RepID=UPI00261F31E7|nr:LPS export ABC transporter periplasmic protein LptC [Roseovarius sp.]